MYVVLLQGVGGYTEEGDTGGGTLHAERLIREWATAGHSVAVVTNTQDTVVSHYSGANQIYKLPTLTRSGNRTSLRLFLDSLFAFAIQLPAVKALVRSTKLELKDAVVITATPFFSDVLLAATIGRRSRTPIVIYFHHLPPAPSWFLLRRGSLLRNFGVWFQSRASLALAKIAGLNISLDHPGELEKAGWKVHSSVLADDDFLPSLPDRETLPDIDHRPIAALYVGRIMPNKGILDLLFAWRIVTERFSHLTLLLAGACYSRAFERTIRDRINRLGIGASVKILGYVSDEEKRSLLSACKLFVFPSYEEGWSLSVMEAAAHGALPVVYDLPAYSYLRNGVIRVPVGDAKKLAESILSVFDNPLAAKPKIDEAIAAVREYTPCRVAFSQMEFFEGLRPR